MDILTSSMGLPFPAMALCSRQAPVKDSARPTIGSCSGEFLMELFSSVCLDMKEERAELIFPRISKRSCQ